MMNQSKFSVRHGVLRWLFLGILLLMSAVALNMQPVIVKGGNIFKIFRDMLGTVQLAHSVAAVALAFFYERTLLRDDAPFSLSALLAGALFAALLITGMSFARFHDFSFIIASSKQYFPALVTFCGYWTILYSGLKALFNRLDNITISERKYDGVLGWIDRHLFLFAFLVMLLCWGIIWAVYFPGSVPYDGRAQFNYFTGFRGASQHPFFVCMFMGMLVSLCSKIVSSPSVIVLYILIQEMLLATVFSSICSYFRKKGMSLVICLLTIAFFALAPFFAIRAQEYQKDSVNLIVFAWFFLEYLKFFLGDVDRCTVSRLTIAAVLTCLFRSEGVYIILPSILMLFFAAKSRWKITCVILGFVLVLGVGVNKKLLTSYGLGNPRSYVESMCGIPFSQVARYVKQYDKDLSKNERKILSPVLQYEKIAEVYDPEFADPVKNNCFRSGSTQEERKQFNKLWLKLGMRHPLVYVEAAYNQMFGYLSPFYFRGGIGTGNADALTSNTNEPIYSEYLAPGRVRGGTWQYMNAWHKTPGLSFLVNPGFYAWVGIFALAAFLRKKAWQFAFVLTPLTLNLLVCFASPVNGSLRYALPYMTCAPLVVFLVLYYYANSGRTSDKQVKPGILRNSIYIALLVVAMALALVVHKNEWGRTEEILSHKQQAARFDIKLNGKNAKFNLIENSDKRARVSMPKDFQKDGRGYVIESTEGKIKLAFKVATTGEMTIDLRGRERFIGKNKLPLWVDFTSLKVNEQTALDSRVAVWHETPQIFSYPATVGETITIEATWQPHDEQIHSSPQSARKTITSTYVYPTLIDLKTARLDIKLNGENAKFDLIEKSDADATATVPAWFQKGGKGYQVESRDGKIKLTFKAETDGKLNVNLRGRDVRDRKDKKKRIPVWIDYTSFKFNGKEELAKITSVWIEKPKNLSYQVKKGDTITIEAAWQQHK